VEIVNILMIAIGSSAVATSIVSLLTYLTKAKREERAPSLQERITTLTENLKSASVVISEIENEISKRNQTAQKLREDVQRYEQLRQLNQPQVEAIAQTIRSEIAGESRKSMWRNAGITFAIALVFFFIGWWVGGL
jgi:peptidoglycan hydrolase CwlO-like protein